MDSHVMVHSVLWLAQINIATAPATKQVHIRTYISSIHDEIHTVELVIKGPVNLSTVERLSTPRGEYVSAL